MITSVRLQLLAEFVEAIKNADTTTVHDCVICCDSHPNLDAFIDTLCMSTTLCVSDFPIRLELLAFTKLSRSARLHSVLDHLVFERRYRNLIVGYDHDLDLLGKAVHKYTQAPALRTRHIDPRLINFCSDCREFKISRDCLSVCVTCILKNSRCGGNYYFLDKRLRREVIPMYPMNNWKIQTRSGVRYLDDKWLNVELAYKRFLKYKPKHTRRVYNLTEMIRVTGLSRHWLMSNLPYKLVKNSMDRKIQHSQHIVTFRVCSIKKIFKLYLNA